MGEGMHHTTPAAEGARGLKSRKKVWFWAAGTGAALVAGGLLMQGLRPATTQAATEAAGQPAAKAPVKILARVNKEIVSYDLVAEECVSRHGKEILDDLINRMIIQQACEANQVVVTDEEITAEIGRIAKRFNLDPGNWYQMLQAERNITPQQYRQSVIWPMLALRKLAGEQVELTDAEIEKAFIRNYGPRVKVRMIMLDNRRRATEIWEKLHAGSLDFEKAAQEFSTDPNSRALGGSVPPIPRFTGNDEIENAAFKLKEGEVSGIIEIAPTRFVILKSEGRTTPTVTNIDEVRESLREELIEQKTQQSVAQVFEDLKKQARVDNYLTSTTTGPDRLGAPAAQGAPGAGTARVGGPARK